MRNRVNGTYEYQFDSSSSLKITADGGIDHKITNSFDSSQTLGADSSFINQNTRRNSSVGDTRTLNSNILWRKKLKKKGRTISFNLKENYNDNVSNGYLFSQITTYEGNSTQKEITDQYKTINSKNILFDSKITYTEPLSKVSSLVFNYGVLVNNSNSERNSFNKTSDGKYSDLDTLYSNDYAFNVLTHRGGLSYSLFQKKIK